MTIIKAFPLVFLVNAIFFGPSVLAASTNLNNELVSNSSYYQSLEDLLNTKISGAASLIATSVKNAPATITSISADQIRLSGARSLDEVLEIYVPGLQIFIKDTGDEIGIRGVNSTSNDKFLLTVNGQIMNDRSVFGATSERFLSMLGDIQHIEVVRNPGSAVHGPGAIAGIVSITTYNAETFEGSDLSLHQGVGERFQTVEFKYGKRFDNNLSLFGYVGVDDYSGANHDDAPYYLSGRTTSFNDGSNITTVSQSEFTWIDQNGESHRIQAHKPLPTDYSNFHEAYEGQNRYKIHLNAIYAIDDHSNYETWLRYTRGGQSTDPAPWSFMLTEDLRISDPEERNGYTPALNARAGYGYKQTTWAHQYNRDFGAELKLTANLTYDQEHYESDNGSRIASHSEDEYLFNSYIDWQPSPDHQLVLGLSHSYNKYGKKADLERGQEMSLHSTISGPGNEWSLHTQALYFEGRYQMTPKLTSWLSLRADRHPATELATSPKLAFVYETDSQAIYKFMLNRSVRLPSERDIRFISREDNYKQIDQFDTVDFFEFSAIHRLSKYANLTTNIYFADSEVLGVNRTSLRNELNGSSKHYGIEVEYEYTDDNFSLNLSHSYTKLLDYDLALDTNRINTTTEPFGYGDDFTSWSSHNTKLVLSYALNQQVTLFSSFNYLWGLPGMTDAANYHIDVLSPEFAINDAIDTSNPAEVDNSISSNGLVNNYSTTVTDGSDDAFKGRGYWHLGGRYDIDKRSAIQMNFYNLLGLIDDDFNIRSTYWRGGGYRKEPISMAVSISHAF